MEFIIDKGVKSPESVSAHTLFGKAVFVECGVHDPEKFCFDHHSMEGSIHTLSSAGMLHQEIIQRRRLPSVVVMNHVRHLDNLMALYLLINRGSASHPDTFQLVSVADLIDRVGPLAVSSVPQIPFSVLSTAQSMIPFKEWELGEEELAAAGLAAVASIRSMVTAPQKVVSYETLFESEDGKFIVVTTDQFLGTTLYDQGYDAYAAYAQNEDGSLKWTLARASEYVPFDIPSAVAGLNEKETGWGGRATIAGSPKPQGSNLNLEEVLEVLKSTYKG